MSSERLERITQVVERAIAAKQISGAVTVVARRGRVAHFEAQGLLDIEADHPMQKDTIFAIASMTKPVTGVAILMLVEEGKVRLRDPVSRFIPEFRDTKVAIPDRSAGTNRGNDEGPPAVYTIPASREITIRDLLTHTSGLVSGGAGAAEASRVAPRRLTGTVAEYAAGLGAAPLDFQPGTQWAYSGLAGIDTLGRVVEVASGLTFDEFLRQRIFEPLGMHDTAFNVSADRQHRVVTLYARGQDGLERREHPAWVSTTTLFSGGGGFWSTAEDYLQFAQMLVNGGELHGVRLLGPRTVDLNGLQPRLRPVRHQGDQPPDLRAPRDGLRTDGRRGPRLDAGRGASFDRKLRLGGGVRNERLDRPARGVDGGSDGTDRRRSPGRRFPERRHAGDRRLSRT